MPRMRGRLYSSCASSTCSFPSALVACWAKMSRISCVRSTTRAVEGVLERLLLRRLELVVDDQHLGVGILVGLLQLLELPLADVRTRIGVRALLHQLGDRLDARGAGELAQLAELLLGVGGAREHGENEPALGLDARAWVLPRRHLRGLCHACGRCPTSPTGWQSARSSWSNIPSESRHEAEIAAHVRSLVPASFTAGVRGRGCVRLGPAAARGQAARRARRPLRHRSGPGERARPDRERRRRRTRRERHEGRPRGDARARAGARGARRRAGGRPRAAGVRQGGAAGRVQPASASVRQLARSSTTRSSRSCSSRPTRRSRPAASAT